MIRHVTFGYLICMMSSCLSNSQRLIVSTYFAGQCYQHMMVGRNVYRTTVDCRRDLYLAARPSLKKYLVTI